jgi:type I restriction enzyme, S subunit
MSNMSFIEKQLDGVEVKWKPLGEIGDFLRGKRFVKTDLVAEGIPCIHYGEMYTHYGVWAKESKSFLNAELASKLRVANHGDVIIVAAGETIEDIGNGTAWLGENDVVIHDACFSYKSKLDPKYVSYFLRTAPFKEQIKKYVSSGKISSINSNGLSKAKIPIPFPGNPKRSLEIQAEIVRILDVFTELTAELTAKLTAELTARKKQHKYYRDQLLSFEEGAVEWKSLGEVYKFQYGTGNTIPTLGGEYPVYGSNGIVGTHHEFNSEDSPVIGHIGAYAGIVNWGAGKHFVTYNGVICKLINKLVHPKYAYYQLLKQDFNSMAKSASHPFVSYDALNKVSIPIPPLPEQERIVATLNKYDALANSTSEGLQREIELRHKQYEYYRDFLFSFHKQEEVAC